MARVELGGYGDPIPLPEYGLEALVPDSGSNPPLVYNLPDGTIFKPGDYIAFGYTHFEVAVIGAAGGRGARGGPIGGWPYTIEPDPIRGGGWMRAVWHNPTLNPSGQYGGAGGGGGLHVVHGRLDELPTEVLVTVGVAGADAPVGYVPRPARGDIPADHPAPFTPTRANTPANGNDRYDGTATLVSPVDGEDGGYSSFGDVAMASGGKGGGAIKQQEGYTIDPVAYHATTRGKPGGDGGDGGIGGRIEAGGGAAGGKTEFVDRSGTAQDYFEYPNGGVSGTGHWDGESIGEGGGGGRGGATTARGY